MNNIKLTLIVSTALITSQTIFLIAPLHFLRLQHLIFTPFIYILTALLVYIKTERKSKKTAPNSLLTSIFCTILFFISILILIFIFGAASNVYTANLLVVLQNLWAIGLCVLLGDYIRFTLIKNSEKKERILIIYLITITLVYSQMFNIHMLLGNDLMNTFFGYIFMPLVIGFVTSYFAITGSLAAVMLFSFVFTMPPYMLPILPNMPVIMLYVIISGLAYISFILYYIINDKPNRKEKRKLKRLQRYKRKSIFELIFFASIITLVASFFSGFFVVYPLAIRTNSMAGTFERGSLVFVERVPRYRVFDMVGEGYIIHYRSSNNMNLTFTHRVIAFETDVYGGRIFITRGDAYEYSYSHVYEEEVLGIVRAFIPHIGIGSILLEEFFLRARHSN